MSDTRPGYFVRALWCALALMGLMSGVAVAGEPKADKRAVSELALLRSLPVEVVERWRGGSADARGYVGFQQQQKEFEAGNQRGGMYTMAMGVVLKRQPWIDEGWLVAEATFAHQQEDGSLGDVANDKATTNAFFLCWFARAMSLLAESGPSEADQKRVKAIRDKWMKAITWLGSQQVALLRENGKSPNRLLIAANAFVLSGMVLRSDDMITAGRFYITKALACYNAEEGFFIEHGGGDSSYQATNIIALLYLQMRLPDPQWAVTLRQALAWQVARIDANGEVSIAGNSRTGNGQEVYRGKPKGINHTEVIQSLVIGGTWAGDHAAVAAGQRVHGNKYGK